MPVPILILLALGVNAETGPAFTDVTSERGLDGLLKNWSAGHAAAWGDVDDDGRPDLYVGAFADRPLYSSKDAIIPNQLLLNREDGFVLSPDAEVRLTEKGARSSCAIFADLDGDRDLDLFVSNHVRLKHHYPSVLFENVGGGKFKDVTPKAGDWPERLAVRNATVIDFDQDGSLELVLTDGDYQHILGSGGRLHVLRLVRKWVYEDITEKLGFPSAGTPALGLATGDANNDGKLDVFVAQSNRMFISSANGKYRESQPGTFVKPTVADGDALTCGAAFGDLNGDGLLDLVTTEHGQPCRLHVYLNQKLLNGSPVYSEISDDAGVSGYFPSKGLTGHRFKTAHVSLVDLDNDGLVDIYVPVLYQNERDELQPMILRNLGNREGVPQFSKPPYGRVVEYFASAPVADFDRDGRLDLFMTGWLPEVPSRLWRNTSQGGHWLILKVVGEGSGFNAMGVGATVRLYRPGSADDKNAFIGRRDISIGNGYSSGEEALAHFGLGSEEECDIVVVWQDKQVVKKKVKANQMIRIKFGNEGNPD